MTGVEILNAKEVIVGYDPNLTAVFVAAAIAFLLTFAWGIYCAFADNDPISVDASIIAGFVIAIMAAALTYAISRTPIYATQYEVTVSDSTSMNDFTEKYEIIDIRGKVFTVQERSDENAK